MEHGKHETGSYYLGSTKEQKVGDGFCIKPHIYGTKRSERPFVAKQLATVKRSYKVTPKPGEAKTRTPGESRSKPDTPDTPSQHPL